MIILVDEDWFINEILKRKLYHFRDYDNKSKSFVLNL